MKRRIYPNTRSPSGLFPLHSRFFPCRWKCVPRRTADKRRIRTPSLGPDYSGLCLLQGAPRAPAGHLGALLHPRYLPFLRARDPESPPNRPRTALIRLHPTPSPVDWSERHACSHSLPQCHRDIVLPAVYAGYEYTPTSNAKRFLRSVNVAVGKSLGQSPETLRPPSRGVGRYPKESGTTSVCERLSGI